MKRMYKEGIVEGAKFFFGYEIEKTPAYGKKTLFVTDVQPVDNILTHYSNYNCEHIFFGANQSFDPGLNFPEDAGYWEDWEDMIEYFLKRDILCTLDIPVKYAEEFLDSGLVEYNCFIPQLRVPVPYIKQWNYNTMLKIDDRDFKSTNPGVWCHSLHDLMNRQKFTDWSEYGLDDIIE